MIIYNITINVNWSIHDDWFQWLKQEYIPAVLKTGCFIESKILRLLEIDDEEGPTYAIQFHAATADAYEVYSNQYAAPLNQQTLEKWGDQIIAFRSVMEVLH